MSRKNNHQDQQFHSHNNTNFDSDEDLVNEGYVYRVKNSKNKQPLKKFKKHIFSNDEQ